LFIADFHIHSKYSRATSKECIPEMLDLWARRKGLGVVGTGDFTHPAWRQELKEKLAPAEEGLYTLKADFRREDKVAGGAFQPRFIVSGEISSIYKKKGKVRKVHNLILLPGLEAAQALSVRLEAIGNLHSDGRPILGLDSHDLLEITLEVCPEAIFIPAHIWTPHFSLFGAYSGFDDIKECFEDLTGHIHALETGLSSDPPMNWRLSALDGYTLVSNSDAHSPANLAREANLFETVLSYPHISRALYSHNTKEFVGTIEFFPEEGKYHYDGHRNCKVCLKPGDTRAAAGICPVCGSKITIGVLHRVEELADRKEGFVPPAAKRFESLVPLHEVIAASTGVGAASIKVKEKYVDLIQELGPELFILREAQLGDIELKAGPLVSEGIRRLRSGKVEVQPGYDGEYGKIKILDKGEIERLSGQLGLFKEKKERRPAAGPDKKSPARAAHSGRSLWDIQPEDKNRNMLKEASREALFGLNPQQWEAVSAREPVVAVVAGPGTGKTRTLVSRITYLTQQCGVPPAQIMAVTFTNRAANEMRTRLAKQLGEVPPFDAERRVKELTIGTFHSICLRMLSEQNGKKPVTIIDEFDALSLMEDILKGLRLKESARDVLRGLSLMKSGAQPAGEKIAVPAGVCDLYCAQLEHFGVLDYDDILLKTLEMLENRDNNNNRSFSHILVDEFQDINATQYRLIKEWGKNSSGIFVIGDPDQSIYAFRGSDARCFNRLREDFPGLRQVCLTLNYRSTPEIIRGARAVISQQKAKEAPSLEAGRESGTRVRLLETNGELMEAIFVAKEINRMVGGIDMLDAHKSPVKGRTNLRVKPRGLSDIAVLYRTNHQAEVLEECLLKEGIPYMVAGRDEFLSDREVRKMVAFFRFILNPADLVSLGQCLKMLDAGRPEYIAVVLGDYALSAKDAASLAEVLNKTLSGYTEDHPSKFSELLRKFEPLVSRENPQKLIESWITENELDGLAGLEKVLNTAHWQPDMASFLQNLLLGRESDILRSSSRGSYSPDAVSLMTLHAAKGLEFPVVFLCGVREGLIPLQFHDGGCNYDEERRLFYVGMTRVQDELILLAPGAKSPFLADIPADILSAECLSREKVDTGKKAAGFEQLSFFAKR
jgi:uncharacterized protein (TIGR00375 family)